MCRNGALNPRNLKYSMEFAEIGRFCHILKVLSTEFAELIAKKITRNLPSRYPALHGICRIPTFFAIFYEIGMELAEFTRNLGKQCRTLQKIHVLQKVPKKNTELTLF